MEKKIILSPRASGKTSRAVEWVSQKPGYRWLITFSEQEKKRLRRRYWHIKDYIITWRDYTTKHITAGKRVGEICIDNADYILQSMCKDDISLITMTEDEMPPTKKID